MRKPTDSLDNFIGRPAPKVEQPPRPVSVKLTGQVDVLKPLATSNRLAKRKAVINDPSVRSFPLGASQSHPALAMGAGFAVIALILLSAVFIGINEPPVEQTDGSMDFAVDPSDLATDEFPGDILSQTEEPFTSDINSASSGLNRLHSLRSTATSRRARRGPRLAAYRPRRPRRRLILVTEIVPTTLVIYPEDGEIKTRIELQVSALYRKPIS